MVEIECVLDAKAGTGESPVWCPEEAALYWVDIPGRAPHRFDPATGLDRLWSLGQEIGCFALRREGSGGVLAAMRHGFYLLDLGTGALEPLYDPETGPPDNRFNDGAVDPRGRLRAGTISMGAADAPRGAARPARWRNHGRQYMLPGGGSRGLAARPVRAGERRRPGDRRAVEKPTGAAVGGPGSDDVMNVTSIRGGMTPATPDRRPRAGGGPFAVHGTHRCGLPPARFVLARAAEAGRRWWWR